jgi:hypothetical protein
MNTGTNSYVLDSKIMNERWGVKTRRGPRDWLCQTAGAAAPSGLEPAAPNLPEQVWTGARSEASGERRPARCRELRVVNDRGGHIHWLILRASSTWYSK